MSRKFTVEKQVEYKNGQVDTWYMIKLEQANEMVMLNPNSLIVVKMMKLKHWNYLMPLLKSGFQQVKQLLKK
jgi:hypothetical protein